MPLPEADVNDRAIEDWIEETTAFDRVTQTLDVTTDPQSAGEIADRAEVSEPTARKYLTSLADVGRVQSIETSAGRTYKRSPRSIAMRRISAIHREHTREEISDRIQALEAEIADLQETYDVTDVDALVTERADPDRWSDVARWRQIEDDLDVARAALQLYDYDPDTDAPAIRAGEGDVEQGSAEEGDRGAFGLGDAGQTA